MAPLGWIALGLGGYYAYNALKKDPIPPGATPVGRQGRARGALNRRLNAAAQAAATTQGLTEVGYGGYPVDSAYGDLDDGAIVDIDGVLYACDADGNCIPLE